MKKIFAFTLVVITSIICLCACGAGYETLYKAKGYTTKRMTEEQILEEYSFIEEGTVKWAMSAENEETGASVFIIEFADEQTASDMYSLARITTIIGAQTRINGNTIAIGTEEAVEIFSK